MTTKLHFWDVGDRSAGIGSNQTEIVLELDGSSAEETTENIAHAKWVLCKALGEIWGNGSVHAMTETELQHGAEADWPEAWEVVGSSGRVLHKGSKAECEDWVAAGNIGGSYSIEPKQE